MAQARAYITPSEDHRAMTTRDLNHSRLLSVVLLYLHDLNLPLLDLYLLTQLPYLYMELIVLCAEALYPHLLLVESCIGRNAGYDIEPSVPDGGACETTRVRRTRRIDYQSEEGGERSLFDVLCKTAMTDIYIWRKGGAVAFRYSRMG